MLEDSGTIPFEPIEEQPAELIEPASEVAAELARLPILVDVKGAVKHPGVYSLTEGDRLIDAVDAAGGYLADADTRLLNHAMKLADEDIIYVPVDGEEVPNFERPHSGQASAEPQKVNINTASEAELQTLSGIGPSKANAIVQYRTDFGAFQKIEDLMEVSGIGSKTFEKLESQITVNK